MTEDEARTKWCPFARYSSHNGMAINRWVNADDKQLNPDPAKCIASTCMAWRWDKSSTSSGHCGLAGA